MKFIRFALALFSLLYGVSTFTGGFHFMPFSEGNDFLRPFSFEEIRYITIFNLYYGVCCFMALYLLISNSENGFLYKNNMVINISKLILLLHLVIPILYYIERGSRTYAYIEVYGDGTFFGPMLILIVSAFNLRMSGNQGQYKKSKRVLNYLYLSAAITFIFVCLAVLAGLCGC